MYLFLGLFVLALGGEGEGGGLYGGPFLAQGFDNGGQDEAFDIGAWVVVCAEFVALVGVEGAFE